MSDISMSQENDDKNKKNNWLVALVFLLVFLLTAQTAAVIYYLSQKEKVSSSPSASLHSKDPSLSYSGASQHSQKGGTSPYTRNFHKAYDPLFADALESMSRLEDHFNHMLGQWRSSAPAMADFFGGADDFDFMPTVDLAEHAADYVVKVDLPGIDKDNISITVNNDLLTIQGVRQSETETKDEDNGIFKQERSYGSFARSLRLPGPVDDSRIAADYKNGVLTIKLPKAPETPAESKKIAIQ